MKKSKMFILIPCVILLISIIIINIKSKNNYIENIVHTESYSYLSNEAIEYIKEVYKKTNEVILTEKNKELNKPYLNPEYVKYLSLSSEQRENVEVIPEVYSIDYKYDYITNSYPSYYDLRNVGGKNFTSPLKNQESLGICWAFAASEQAESYLLKEDGLTYQVNPINLSPRQLDYALSIDGITNYSNEFGYRYLTEGGSFIQASQVMASGLSLYDENDFPFDLNTTTKSLNKVLNYHYSQYELNNSVIMPKFTDVSNSAELNNYITTLKSIVYNYGGAVISAQNPQGNCGITNTDGKIVLRADNTCSTYIAHDMQIIGWDDNYEYKYCIDYGHKEYSNTCNNVVNGTGAWIIRNSWGNSVEPKFQYLYIPYDSNNYQVAASTNIEDSSTRTWDRSYVETPFEDLGNSQFGYSYASSYTASYQKSIGGTEKLEKVKFSALNVNGKYNLRVYANNHVYNNFGIIETTYPGIYTIDVSSYNILIDNDFSVTVSSTNGGQLLYSGVYAFTSYVDDNVALYTPDIQVELSNNDYFNVNDLYVYSKTANINSNNQVTYELYDSSYNNLTTHITSINDNIIAHNDVLAKLNITSLNAGDYILRVKYSNTYYDSNITLVGKPSVHFHSNYGNDDVVDQLFDKNIEFNLMTDVFTRTGYIFTGWNTASNGTGTTYEEGAYVTLDSDLTLYAVWTPITYKIVFNSNNELNEEYEQTFTYDEPQALMLNAFEYPGYEFDYWSFEPSGYYLYASDGDVVINITSEQDYTFYLYAIWKKGHSTITFDANNGTNETTTQTIESLTPTSLNKNTFTKLGYIFNGWNTESNGTGTPYTDEQIVNLTSNIYLYAEWIPITYKVVFHSNNGLNETMEQKFTYDESKALNLNTFTKSNCHFNHWASSPSDSTPHYTNGQVVSNLSNINNDTIDLYAIWENENIGIMYDANGGLGLMDNQIVTPNTDTQLNKNIFSRLGYIFTGWNTASNGTGTPYADEEMININEPLVLYAEWAPITYTVIFKADNSAIYTIETSYDANIEIIEAPKKTGYVFTNWNTFEDNNGVSFLEHENVKNLTSINNDVVEIYAIYNPITYKIRFNPNGGVGYEQILYLNYDENYVLTNNSYTKDGFTLTGYSVSPDNGGLFYPISSTIKNLTTIDDATIDLYAIWVENKGYEIKNYIIDETNKYIDKIPLNTPLNTFNKNIILGNNYSTLIDLYSKNYIYTGLTLKILKNGTVIDEYKCIVRGDVNGDGKASALDYVKIKNHIMGTNLITDNIFKLSADANEDNKKSALDYVRIKNIIMKG